MKYIERETYRGITEISIYQTEAPHPQAQLASDLMRNIAIAACVPEGVDAGGHQIFRLMSPTEVVARATDIADLAWREYRQRGWLLDVPLPKVGEDGRHAS